jgi:hypothetical protein
MSILSNDEHLQRALNEAKRHMLEERFGARFGGGSSSLPPDIERDWLDYVERFEVKFENAETVTVRAFLGSPHFPLLGELLLDELPRELDRLLTTLDDNNIQVEFPEQISREEKYRSITEELFNEEIENIRIEGMVHVFIYGETNTSGSDDRTAS